MHYNFFIVNKIGLLIYERKFQGHASLDSNDMVRYGATLSALHLLSGLVTPPALKKTGLRFINSKYFKMCCFESKTGVKFFLVSDPNNMEMEKLCKATYKHYTDYVLKNPFYESDQQIRFEGFDRAIDELFVNKQ